MKRHLIYSAKSLLSITCSSCHGDKCAPFIFCQPEELGQVSAAKTCQQYGKGQVIFQEGSPTSGLYCVHSGKIRVIKAGGDGKEQVVHLAKEGDILGLSALMTDATHSTSAVTLEESIVCFVPRSSFLHLLVSNSQFCAALMRLLADSLKQAETGMLHLAYKPVRERLASALLLLLHTYQPTSTHEPDPFSIIISREELASLAGTVKETTIRLLSEFKEDGIIISKGSQITILKPEKLSEIAALYA